MTETQNKQIQPLELGELRELQERLGCSDARAALKAAALNLLEQPEYMNWLQVLRYQGAPFKAGDEPTLRTLGLVDEAGYLRVQIHKQRERLFITDSPSATGQTQVYPWDDESDAILEWVSGHWKDWADCSIDPMCGCGHSNISLSENISTRLSYDINERAVCYTVINGIINGIPLQARVNDIRNGLMEVLAEGKVAKEARVLLMVNAPFALSPIQGVLPLSSDGGEAGTILSKAALDAVKELRGHYAHIRLCQLVYSVGNPERETWYLEDYARELFGSAPVKFTLLPKRKLWRVNGKKEEANPMPLSHLQRKAFCAFQVEGSAEQRQALAKGYDRLADHLLRQYDATHLGYGIISVDLSEQAAG